MKIETAKEIANLVCEIQRTEHTLSDLRTLLEVTDAIIDHNFNKDFRITVCVDKTVSSFDIDPKTMQDVLFSLQDYVLTQKENKENLLKKL